MNGRGTGWVVSQFLVMGTVLAVGLVPPYWPEGWQHTLSIIGGALAIGGGVLALWASRTLGRSFTPFPKPVEAGLVTGGPFAIVRHPVYTGGLVLFVGYSLHTSLPSLAVTAALAVLWAAKVRVEERFLEAVYPGYAAYCGRVRRRLIPFVY